MGIFIFTKRKRSIAYACLYYHALFLMEIEFKSKNIIQYYSIKNMPDNSNL